MRCFAWLLKTVFSRYTDTEQIQMQMYEYEYRLESISSFIGWFLRSFGCCKCIEEGKGDVGFPCAISLNRFWCVFVVFLVKDLCMCWGNLRGRNG